MKTNSAFYKFMSVILSCALCFSFCGPCQSWAIDLRAASSDDLPADDGLRAGSGATGKNAALSVYAEGGLAAKAIDAKDLNALWAAQTGGTSSPYTISEPGTYALTADLETRGMLSITAQEGVVTLLLEGHTFTCRELTVGAAVRVSKKATVVIDGTATEGASAIVYEGGMTPVAVRTESQSITLRNLTIKAHTDDAYSTLTRYNAYGVYGVSGSLKMESCTVDVDLTNQSNASVDASKYLKGSPSGIYLERNVSSATIENCTVTCTNSPLVVRSSYTDATAGYAYGLYSTTQGTVTVRGGSFSATCARGTASAMCLAAADLQPGTSNASETSSEPIKVSVGAGVLAVGVQGTLASGVKLNAPLEIDLIDEYAPETSAGLYASVDNAFVFEKDFSTKKTPVLVDVVNGAPNDTGAIMGAVPSRATQDEAQRVLGLFENAQGPSAPTYPALQGHSIAFALDEAKAPVAIAAASGQEVKRYSSVIAAIAALADGQTVRLLADAGDIDFSPKLSADALVGIDLNGHTAQAVKINTDADVKLTSNSQRALVTGSLSGYGICHKGAGLLIVSNLDVICHSPSASMSGLSVDGGGAVYLEDVGIESVSERGYARGISVNAANATVIANGGSISAYTNTAGVVVYGASTSNQTDSVSLIGCPVSVEGVSGNTGGFYGRGTFSLRPDSNGNGSSIAVRTLGVAANAWGVNMASASGSTSKAVLEDANISVTSTADVKDSAYWCLMSGGAQPANATEWVFEGSTLSLISANDTHIGQYGVAMKAAPDLQINDRVTLFSANLDDDVALQPIDSGNLQALADCFVAAEGSAYEGWSLGATSEGSLSWQHDDVVANTTTGKRYSTLQQALVEASSEDQLVLVGDCEAEGPVAITVPLSLDVSGYVLKVCGKRANATNAGSGGALVYSGAGALILKDNSSEASGCVLLSLGYDAESATTAATAYQGIAVCNGGSLTIDGCSVEAVYSGATSSYPEVGMRAIAVQNGSVSLENGACVTARACEQGASFGACDTVGIYLYGENSSEGQTVLSVDATSSIIVKGDIPAYERGTLLHSESLEVARYDSYDLRRIEVDEDSELYQQILQKFREVAALDSNLEDSSVYDSGIYYAVPLVFDEGVYIWAYSEPCKAGKIGELESIVPKLLFTQSKHRVVGNATGVSGEVGFSGTVDVKGRVDVAVSEGDALCLVDKGAGMWKLEGGILNAAGGSGTRDVVMDALDLRNYLDLPEQSSRMSYPDGARQKVVSSRAARSYGFFAEDGESGTVIEGSPAVTAIGADAQQQVMGCSDVAEAMWITSLDDIRAWEGPVTVTFGNLRAADGSPLPDCTTSVDYGASIDAEAVPLQESFVKGGSTFRFVGWSPTIDVIMDPQDMAALTFDASVTGATSGKVVFNAVYVEVGSGQKLVTFKVGDQLTAYAESVGAHPSYAAANASNARHIPTMSDKDEGYVSTFRGWFAGQSSSSSSSVDCISGVLPAVSNDAFYTASFEQKPGLRKMAFCYWKANGDGAVYANTGYLDLPYASDPGLVAQEYVRPGDCVSDGDVVYLFEGWSVRKTDKQPVYEQLPPVDLKNTEAKEVYYGIYSMSGILYDVNFIVDGAVVTTLTETKGSQTIDSAFRATGASTPTAPEGKKFLGWGLSETDEKQLSGAIVSVADAYQRSGGSNSTLNLYALFGKKGSSTASDDEPGSSTDPTEDEGQEGDGQNDGESSSGGSSSSLNPSPGSISGSSSTSTQRRTSGSAIASIGSSSAIANVGSGSAISRSGSGSAITRSGSGSAITNVGSTSGAAIASSASIKNDASKTGNQNATDATGKADDADWSGDSSGSGFDSESSPANAAVSFLCIVALLALVGFALWKFLVGRRRRREEDLDEDMVSPAFTEKECVSF